MRARVANTIPLCKILEAVGNQAPAALKRRSPPPLRGSSHPERYPPRRFAPPPAGGGRHKATRTGHRDRSGSKNTRLRRDHEKKIWTPEKNGDAAPPAD
jgi:hypothetical protein